MIKLSCTVFDENSNKTFCLGPFAKLVFNETTIYDGADLPILAYNRTAKTWTILLEGQHQGVQVDEFALHP